MLAAQRRLLACNLLQWPPRIALGDRAYRGIASTVGLFRRKARVEGVTVVATPEAAERALEELHRLRDRPHAWDTETADLLVGRTASRQSPVSRGRAVCATCYCGDDADFGSGPRLFVDNCGPAEGLLEKYFKEYFEEERFRKVFHNYSFERHIFARHGIRLRGYHADTLHLARLYDTSLAAWEGAVQAKLARDAALADAPASTVFPGDGRQTERGSGSAGRRTVLNVRLGCSPLDKQQWANASQLHTSSRSVEAEAPQLMPDWTLEGTWNEQDSERPMPSLQKGYTLKGLASNFGLVDERLPGFAESFGFHETAAQEAHDSPEGFSTFVEYSTKDAVLTYQLFGKLQQELRSRPWDTPVHERPIDEMLHSREVALELLRKGSRKSSSKQYATGRSMWDLFELYIRDLGECLADMEELGIAVDCARLQDIEAHASRDVESRNKEFVDCFSNVRGVDGNPINPDAGLINTRSHQQLRLLLFGGTENRSNNDQRLECTRDFPITPNGATSKVRGRFMLNTLGLEPTPKLKNFAASGWPRTSSEVLARLAGDPSRNLQGEVVGQLEDMGFDADDVQRVVRGLMSLSQVARIKGVLTGFATPLQQHITPAGRIHPSWQFDTSTGRLACRAPNLQNLPSPTQDRYHLREAFRPAPGHVFVIADYAQLELCILAHMANCESMIRKLNRGGDYHSEVAAEMFPHVRAAVQRGEVVVSAAEATPERPSVKDRFGAERSKAKAVNFGIIFGKTPKSLSEDLGIDLPAAEELVQAWYDSKPGVKRWVTRVRRDSQEQKRALSLLGRWRNLPLLDDQVEAKYRYRSVRAAVNFGIQGSAADVVIAAMLRLWRDERLARLRFRLVMQVHDEFVLEGPEGDAEEALAVVKKVMSSPFGERDKGFQLRVPLRVDAVVGSSLGAKA